ncbi:MAG: malectin domain-containing carbohydrate-binding protein [Psychroserpens sp.]|uniref:malectin domain-containing carbohydrate-binding protein n=1 Tax=Psychroserpens sp. TaxID=2020870 RepID=UPI003C8398BE
MRHQITLSSFLVLFMFSAAIVMPSYGFANETSSAAQQAAPSIISLILVNADTNQDIEEINQGDVFFLDDIGTSNLNIRAETTANTESVVFGYQGNASYKIENNAIYAIGGNSGSNYNAWLPDLGANSLTATAYSGNNGGGLAGVPLTVNFEILESTQSLPVIVRINAGGPTITYDDSVFLADDYFAGNGKSYTNNSISNIINTTQDAIYKTERSTNANLQSFTYSVPVTNGHYSINLHFAEIYWGATGGGPSGTGRRIFNVTLEGQAILNNLDLNAQTSPMTAIIESFATTVVDGSLDLVFSASVDQPKLSALEVFGNGSLTTNTGDVIIESLTITNCPTEPVFVGDIVDLDVEILPANTTNQFVSFTASDGSSVDYISGIFTAASSGEITVFTTSFSDGSVFDQCTISILEKPTVNALVLINADTNEDIGVINEGDVFLLDDLGTSNLSVRAEVGAHTESVVFDYQDNIAYQIDNDPVYAIHGNTGDNYNAWVPDLGLNTITATAYAGDDGSSASGESFTINFEIVDNDPVLPAVVRINAGGPTVTYDDSVFIADDYFAGNGKSYTNTNISDIFNTTQDEIYKTERSTKANLQSFSYNIPVTNGDYSINLHFAEIYWGATNGGQGGIGKRIFDVTLEGQSILTNIDLNAEANPMTASIETFTTNVSDGSLDLVFSASVNRPKLSAIEVFGSGSLVVDPTDCTWNALASSTLSKVESQSVKINDKLYTLAGFLSGLQITGATEIYDPATNSWTNGAPMPTPVTHMGAVAVGDEIWILAGFAGNHPGVATNLVQIYNTVTNTWSAGPSLPNPRGSGAAAYSNGKIYFFGGLLPDRKTDVGEHYVLDVNDQASGWQALAPMPEARNHLSAAAVDGLIYAIGGQFGHDNGVSDQSFLHVYNPQTNVWTEKANLPSERSHFEPGTMVHNDKIIIVGGRRGNFFFDDVTEYNPATNSWAELCELPSNLLAPSAKVFGDQLIVTNGGENGTCCPLNEAISITIEPEVEDDFRVLVYHETTGFRHGSINAGISMIEAFGNNNNWTVDNSQNSSIFTDQNLATVDVMVWMNTSGNGLLTSAEKDAVENYIQNGGGFVGFHAATDTYRDGSWPWYNDLVGAIVQTNPNHTANNFNASIDVVGDHPAIEHLGNTWNKNEEYYYWELNGGYLFDGNIDLLRVRSTGNQSYDAARPITWYKNYDGGRSFYTALGHNSLDYSNNENFKTLAEKSILWAGGLLEILDIAQERNGLNSDMKFVEDFEKTVLVYPNPVNDILTVKSALKLEMELKLTTLTGTVLQEENNILESKIDMSRFKSGIYVLMITHNGILEQLKVIKK